MIVRALVAAATLVILAVTILLAVRMLPADATLFDARWR